MEIIKYILNLLFNHTRNEKSRLKNEIDKIYNQYLHMNNVNNDPVNNYERILIRTFDDDIYNYGRFYTVYIFTNKITATLIFNNEIQKTIDIMKIFVNHFDNKF